MKLREAIVKFGHKGYMIRVWTEIAVAPFIDMHYLENLAAHYKKQLGDTKECVEISDVLTALPHVNAVEVTLEGRGIVDYNDWP